MIIVGGRSRSGVHSGHLFVILCYYIYIYTVYITNLYIYIYIYKGQKTLSAPTN